LYFMARNYEPALIQIGDIETTMNYGSVRLVGEVKGDARPFKNGNGMSFTVADGTGSIIVFVDQGMRDAMIADGLVPKKGDEIDFIVQLQSTSSGNSARIRGLNPSSFKLTRADGTPAGSAADRAAATKDLGPATPFAEINESFDGQSVVLEGTVASVKEPAAGTKQPYVLTLADASGANLYIKLWADQYLQLADPKSLPGAAVRVKAAAKLYNGKIDLSLKNGADLQRAADAPKAAASKAAAAEPAPAAPAPAKRDFSRGRAASALAPGDVTADLDGQTVPVSGSVYAVYPPKTDAQPWSVTLSDAATGARLSVKYWDDARAAFARQPAPGDVFEFAGKVNVYNGKPSLVVSSGAKAKFVAEGEPPAKKAAPKKKAAPSKPAVPVSSVTADAADTYVTVEGALSAPSDRAGKGTAYTLTDDTGSVMVVFWNTSIPADLQQKAAAAPRVRVNGKVKDYQGTLQITPGANGLTILD
ncbi:MAG: hypothetical protein IK066_08740, partial [Kiritimatiellae bacterium]|nr:hypothetical protein [Kiritimatiellia bacterium]